MWRAGFPQRRQGMAMGVYGAGNSGAAVNKFIAPVLLVGFGWTMVPQVYAAIMLGTLILFWMFSYSDPKHLVPSNVKFMDQLKALKDPKVIKYCQYYSIVFGGYVAMSLWMVQYYVGEFGLDIRTWPLCLPPASPCPAVCCGRWAACCPTSTAPTA
jgi:NNP family nitrate/nitrite transporter-like MFS transporter